MGLPTLITFHIKKFSTSSVVFGKRNFRKFPLYDFRLTPDELQRRGNEPIYSRGVRYPGVWKNDELIPIKEMIPELVVPDLTGFTLKPYVSYRAPDVIQSEFTAKDLFYACYSKKITEDFEKGKLDEEGNPVEPSEEEKMSADEAWTKARKTGSDLFCAKPPEEEEDWL